MNPLSMYRAFALTLLLATTAFAAEQEPPALIWEFDTGG